MLTWLTLFSKLRNYWRVKKSQFDSAWSIAFFVPILISLAAAHHGERFSQYLFDESPAKSDVEATRRNSESLITDIENLKRSNNSLAEALDQFRRIIRSSPPVGELNREPSASIDEPADLGLPKIPAQKPTDRESSLPLVTSANQTGAMWQVIASSKNSSRARSAGLILNSSERRLGYAILDRLSVRLAEIGASLQQVDGLEPYNRFAVTSQFETGTTAKCRYAEILIVDVDYIKQGKFTKKLERVAADACLDHSTNLDNAKDAAIRAAVDKLSQLIIVEL